MSKIKRDGMLVDGIETHPLRGREARYKQTWRCRLVPQTPT